MERSPSPAKLHRRRADQTAAAAGGAAELPSTLGSESAEKPVAAGDKGLRSSSPSSSFFAVPTVILTGIGLAPLGYCFRCALYAPESRSTPASSTSKRPSAEANSASRLMPALITPSLSTSGTAGPYDCTILRHVWAVFEVTVLRDGPWPALCTTLLAAVVFNHARRTLWGDQGWAGTYLFPQPDEAWRIVLARPDVFLEDSVATATPWRRLLTCALQKRLWDTLAGGCAALLAAADERALAAQLAHRLQLPSLLARTLARRTQQTAAVLFVVWLFSCIEYALARSFHAGAMWYAVAVLCRTEPGFLQHIVTDAPVRTLLLVWSQMVAYPLLGLLPLFRGALGGAVRHRRPGLLLSVVLSIGTMHILLRYRSRLYIAIETSGFFVFLAFLGLSGLLAAAAAGDREDDKEEKRTAGAHAGSKKTR